MLKAANIEQLSVLLIEDSKTDAYAVRRAIKKHMQHPCDLDHVETMEAAQKALKTNKEAYDLILLDLGLPDTAGGEDTFNRLEEVSDDIPVIILTSVNDHKLAVGFVDSGAEDFVRKSSVSADPEVLCEAIDFAVCRHKNLEAIQKETNELLDEKDSVINWMSGAYSKTTEKE